MKWPIIIFVSIFSFFCSKAAVVTGRVTDANDRSPLPFCTVKSGKNVTTTDADGYYRISLPDAMVEISVSYIGYDEWTKRIDARKPVKIDVTLSPADYTLDVVVVTAKESEGISSISRIDRSAMEHLQPSSFTDLLELLPGNMSKDPAMGSANSIQLRETGSLGATGAATDNPDYAISSLGTLFLVDGAPINGDANMQTVGITSDSSSPDYSRNVTNKGVDMRTIATDNIESVEIVRGIPSAEYGNLTSGMVNIKRIRRATPLNARFKADEYSKLFYVGKGFGLKGHEHVLNFDVGYMDSKVDPRDNHENYKRLTASARFTGSWNFSSGVIRWNTSGDYTGSFDNAKVDPDLAYGKIDEYKSTYNRTSVTTDFAMTLTDFKWLNDIKVNASVSYQNDILERHKQVAPSRPSAAPTTMEEGVHDGHYILGEYIADYRSEGKPLNFFLKASAGGRVETGPMTNSYKVGGEWTISKNFGAGQIYDLMRPISATWTSRPRDFSTIPALHVLSFYLQDQMTLDLPVGKFDLQAGLRTISLPHLSSRYSLAGKVYIDPRVNALWHFPAVDKINFFIGGGYGLTTKMPTIDYLYPQAHYNDIIQLNYYDIANPAEYSRLNLRTFIDDATNYDLKPARNRKWEIRLGATFSGNSFSVTYFEEKMRSGFRYTSVYSPYSYRSYDATAIDAGNLTAPPSLDGLPYVDSTVLDGYRKASNGSRIDKMGVEFQFSSARIRPIHTGITVSGAWFKSTYSNSQMLYSTVNDVVNGVVVSDKYVGLYDYNDGRENEQFNTNVMIDTQIPRWGLVFTASVQNMWFVKSRMMDKDGTPAYYLSADDGQLHQFTKASADDIYLRTLIKTYNEDQFKPVKVPWAMYLNFKATKSIGRWLKVSVFVNRIIDYLPDYTVNGLTVRRSASPYFGMELNLTL